MEYSLWQQRELQVLMMAIDKKQIELALLYRKRNDLEKEIVRVKEAHKRNEYAEVNTYQLFVLEDRLSWVNRAIARRLNGGK